MNEPLMHATIALAARFAQRSRPPTPAEARAIARELARGVRLDSRDCEALFDAAERLAAPLEQALEDPGLETSPSGSSPRLAFDLHAHRRSRDSGAWLDVTERFAAEAAGSTAAPLEGAQRLERELAWTRGRVGRWAYPAMATAVALAAVATLYLCSPGGEGRHKAASAGGESRHKVLTGGGTTGAAVLVDTVIGASVEGAHVEIEGTDQAGRVPFAAKLERGKPYRVRVTARGFAAHDMEVNGGDRQTVTLVAKPRVISIASDPPGAAILVDSASTGYTTPFDIELTPAQAARRMVRVQLRKAGFRTVERVVELAKVTEEDTRMSVRLDETLSPRPDGNGYATITSKPSAKIWIDGVDTGRSTPISGYSLPLLPGRHKVTFIVDSEKFTFGTLIKLGEVTAIHKDLEGSEP